LVALGAIVLAVAAVLGWGLAGGKLVVMQTQSMCPAVCVGSLVGDRPLRGPVHAGELVTFHPPDSSSETYTHEIWHIFANGMVQTKGVANPVPDPWLITRSDIVGRVVFSVWGLGWLFDALPLLAVGVMAWLLARPWVAARSRRAWDRVWMTVLIVLPVCVLRPLVRAAVVSITADPTHRGWARATVVNTGILPVSFHTAGGQVTGYVRSTALAHLPGPLSAKGSLALYETVSLYWWGWVVLVALVVSPLAGYLWHVWRDNEVVPDLGPTGKGLASRT
jgi:hypothetical protein